MDIAASLEMENVEFLDRKSTDANYRERSPLHMWLQSTAPPLEGNVIASSYAFAHHRRATGRTVIYCHSPLRQIWSGFADYSRSHDRLLNRFAHRTFAAGARPIDKRAAQKADAVIATNRLVRERIWTSYRIDPIATIAPPVDDEFFRPTLNVGTSDYFLWVGRIVEPYKRLGLVIEAFRGRSDKLVVVGEGRDRDSLAANAPRNVIFEGRQDAPKLAELYAGARALIFPSVDDFGMVPIEAMAAGTPIIAFDGGGAKETVCEGLTGTFFKTPDPQTLRAALDQFQDDAWNRSHIRAYASRFSEASFARQVASVLSSLGD